MENARLLLLVPARCRFCDMTDSVVLETAVQGRTVALGWCCYACHKEWPVTAESQQIDRRASATDRRRSLDGERRGA